MDVDKAISIKSAFNIKYIIDIYRLSRIDGITISKSSSTSKRYISKIIVFVYL